MIKKFPNTEIVMDLSAVVKIKTVIKDSKENFHL